MSMRFRFAPSPTGHLHIGGARTALFNWLLARKHDGVFLLRIEDTDRARSKAEHEAQVLRDMAWMGLDWDEGPSTGGDYGPYRQSERQGRYDTYIARMLEEGTAYRCTCSKERLTQVREAAQAKGEKPKYDGHCRNLNLGPDCGDHVVRFKAPLDGATVVKDLVKGDVTFRNEELDDLIIQRTDGSPTYNFVVVIDDHEMKVTHVVRGDDHLNNTPKQQLLYEALGLPVPAFGHLPIILGDDGGKMSKRHGSTSVGAYRENGFLPEALFNYLTRVGWACGHGALHRRGGHRRLWSGRRRQDGREVGHGQAHLAEPAVDHGPQPRDARRACAPLLRGHRRADRRPSSGGRDHRPGARQDARGAGGSGGLLLHPRR